MIINPYAFGVAYDPDAQAFFTASGLTGATNLTAVNQLVLDLKAANIWTKMKGIYPFVGGTASLHKWNLKDPRDLNVAFRLVFSGGWIHNSLGIKMNNTNTAADTFIGANNGTNIAMSAYLTQRLLGSQGVILGSYPSDTLGIRAISLTQDNFHNNSGTAGKSITPVVVSPFLGNSRTATNAWFAQNGNNVFTNYTDAPPSVTNNLRIGNFTATTWYGNHQLGFVHISEALSQAEMTLLRTAVIAFQTTLGRNV